MKLMFDKLQFVVTLVKSSMLREQTSSMRLVEAYEVDDKLKETLIKCEGAVASRRKAKAEKRVCVSCRFV